MIHKRQTDMFDPANHAERHVTVVGLGNIGSHTAIALAKMGIQNFTLYDFDEVEEHNTASQAFVLPQNGMKKTEAISTMIQVINSESDVTIFDTDKQEELGAFRGTEKVHDILVIAVDSMIERQKICENLLASGQNPFVIDGRMGGGQIEVWAQRASEWGATFSDNPDSDPCSARYISYTSYVIAGIITNTVKRFLQGERLCKRFVMHLDTYDVISQFYEETTEKED